MSRMCMMKQVAYRFWLALASFCAMVCAPTHVCFAQGDETGILNHSISVSRPSFSAPPTTLEPGHWQLEAGFQYSENDDKGVDTDTATLPFLFLRRGLSDRLEANVFWSGYTDQESNTGDANGASDLTLGLNYHLSDVDSPLQVGVSANLSLPVGSDDFSSNDVDPGLGLAWSYATGGRLGWFGTFVVNSVTQDKERASTLGAAIGSSYTVNEKVSAYVEYFGVHSDSDNSTHSINGGLGYLLSKDIQFDVYGGAGLNHAAADYFMGAGLAWRY